MASAALESDKDQASHCCQLDDKPNRAAVWDKLLPTAIGKELVMVWENNGVDTLTEQPLLDDGAFLLEPQA